MNATHDDLQRSAADHLMLHFSKQRAVSATQAIYARSV